MKTLFTLLFALSLLNSCETGLSNNKNTPTLTKETEVEEITPPFYKPIIRRDSIIKNMKTKIENNQPLVVHVFALALSIISSKTRRLFFSTVFLQFIS